jgi:hypothetical protein
MDAMNPVAEAFAELIEALLDHVDDTHPRSFLDEALNYCTSDTGPAPGDQSNLTI